MSHVQLPSFVVVVVVKSPRQHLETLSGQQLVAAATPTPTEAASPSAAAAALALLMSVFSRGVRKQLVGMHLTRNSILPRRSVGQAVRPYVPLSRRPSISAPSSPHPAAAASRLSIGLMARCMFYHAGWHEWARAQTTHSPHTLHTHATVTHTPFPLCGQLLRFSLLWVRFSSLESAACDRVTKYYVVFF